MGDGAVDCASTGLMPVVSAGSFRGRGPLGFTRYRRHCSSLTLVVQVAEMLMIYAGKSFGFIVGILRISTALLTDKPPSVRLISSTPLSQDVVRFLGADQG